MPCLSRLEAIVMRDVMGVGLDWPGRPRSAEPLAPHLRIVPRPGQHSPSGFLSIPCGSESLLSVCLQTISPNLILARH